MDAEKYFKGKKITLMGLGLLGRGVGDARFLASLGAELTVTDLKTEEQLASSLSQLKAFPNIIYRLGEHDLADFRDRDLIIKAAGVPLDSLYIAEAKKNNIPVRMSADLFAEFAGVPIVGITGTRGKSTVTHLIAHLLKEASKKVLLGGNIKGVSNLELLSQITPDSIAVLELDSWQLQGFGEAKMSPRVAVFTTFMPDHMNYYKNDMQSYFADKANIFLYQEENDTLVLGEQVISVFKEYGYQNKVRSHVVIASEKDIPKNITLKIPGEHNRYNAGLAAAAARVFGIEDEKIKAALESFKGVEGRLQLLKEIHGIKIYNDTTATTPEATIAALNALDPDSKQNILLIMGGADKGLNMEGMRPAVHAHTKKCFFLAGSGTDRIKADSPETAIYQNLPYALNAAIAAASAGDVVLFSPAFASFGMFKNEYDRGDQFNALVQNLK